MKELWLIFVAILAFSFSALAQTQRKIPVEIDYTGNDSVGGRVVFSFKEAMRRSTSYGNH